MSSSERVESNVDKSCAFVVGARGLLFLLVIMWPLAASGPLWGAQPADYRPDDAVTLAWARFETAPDKIGDRPSYRLVRQEIELRMDVKPGPGHVLEILWGSGGQPGKAILTINGLQQTILEGDFRGLRWGLLPIPETVQGERYEIRFRPGGGKPAFLAEARLTCKSHTGPAADLLKPVYKTTVAVKPLPEPSKPKPAATPAKRPARPKRTPEKPDSRKEPQPTSSPAP